MQKITLLKVRDFGEVFNDTFAFIRQNLLPLVKPSIIIAGPLFFIAGIFYGKGLGSYYGTVFSSAGEDIPDFGAMESSMIELFINYGIAYIFFIIGYIIFVTLINSYILLYKNTDYEPAEITTAMVWQESKKHFGMVIITTIITIILLFIGFMLCFVPGIFLMVPFSFLIIMRMNERQLGLGEALRKCFKLVENHWWFTFGLLIVLSLIYSIIRYTLSLPVTLGIAGSAFFGAGAIGTIIQSLLMGFTYLFSFLLSGILYVGIAITYFTHRERLEGISLKNKIDNLGRVLN